MQVGSSEHLWAIALRAKLITSKSSSHCRRGSLDLESRSCKTHTGWSPFLWPLLELYQDILWSVLIITPIFQVAGLSDVQWREQQVGATGHNICTGV